MECYGIGEMPAPNHKGERASGGSHGDDTDSDGVIRETKSLVITRIEDFRTTSVTGPQPYTGEETRVPPVCYQVPVSAGWTLGRYARRKSDGRIPLLQGVEEVNQPSLDRGTDSTNAAERRGVRRRGNSSTANGSRHPSAATIARGSTAGSVERRETPPRATWTTSRHSTTAWRHLPVPSTRYMTPGVLRPLAAMMRQLPPLRAPCDDGHS
jgi:hypothetical protein